MKTITYWVLKWPEAQWPYFAQLCEFCCCSYSTIDRRHRAHHFESIDAAKDMRDKLVKPPISDPKSKIMRVTRRLK
jgi:hypothetical protein